MPLDLSGALARLLTDETLRGRFFADRGRLISELGVAEEDCAALLGLDRVQIEAHAETLLEKRLHEAMEWLPVTRSQLGKEGKALFRSFAKHHWSREHPRPLSDAIAFCRRQLAEADSCVCQAELQRLEFLRSGSALRIRIVRNVVIGGKRRTALHILYRRAGRDPSGRILYVGAS